MKRLRCCGRFCYWRVPLGPWECATCYRTSWPDEPGVPGLPKAHAARFWAAIDAQIASAPNLTPMQIAWARAIVASTVRLKGGK